MVNQLRRGRSPYRTGILLVLGLTVALVLPAGSSSAQADQQATRQWVLEHLHAALALPLDLDRIASMIYGLVSDRWMAAQPDTRQALGKLADRVREFDPAALDCEELVNLRFIGSFINMAGIRLATGQLDRPLQVCLGTMDPFNRASALFALCRFPAHGIPADTLAPALESIEALQRRDGGFGSHPGLRRYYVSTHAVFALHTCGGNPDVVRRGQLFLRNGLPRMLQAGFIDGLLESLIMLRKMGVPIADEKHYTGYLRAKIRPDGSICYFDRPACTPDVHATSLLLEFLQEFPDRH